MMFKKVLSLLRDIGKDGENDSNFLVVQGKWIGNKKEGRMIHPQRMQIKNADRVRYCCLFRCLIQK
jgi:hypothetical protein